MNPNKGIRSKFKVRLNNNTYHTYCCLHQWWRITLDKKNNIDFLNSTWTQIYRIRLKKSVETYFQAMDSKCMYYLANRKQNIKYNAYESFWSWESYKTQVICAYYRFLIRFNCRGLKSLNGCYCTVHAMAMVEISSYLSCLHPSI